MSLITHRCTQCGHPDYWRPLRGNKKEEVCESDRCGCRCTPGEPELAPTFGVEGRPIERILKPGEKFYTGAPTCGCGQCKALYAELAGAAA